MTLTEFLRARLDEDEQVARAADAPITWGPMPLAAREHCSRHDPARVLAEVEAKRRLVDEHRATDDGYCSTCLVAESDLYGKAFEQSPCWHLRVLALPYADHPDYHESWKP